MLPMPVRKTIGAIFWVGCLLGVVLVAAPGGPAANDSNDAAQAAGPGPAATMVPLHRAGQFLGDVRQLPALPQPPPGQRRQRPRLEEPPLSYSQGGPDLSLQPPGVAAPAPSPSVSFAGLDFANWGDGWPPDTVGDVGPTHFIQAVNTSVGIFRKSDGARLAAFTFDSLMSQGNFGNPCDNRNFGDPTVVYDGAADRWFISDFAFAVDANSHPIAPYYQCFAVSRSGDPIGGGWYFYSLQTTDFFPDYPKLGIWPDGLYLTADMFGATFKNGRVWALNKDQMEAGAAASAQFFDLPGKISGVDVFAPLPSTYHPATGIPPAGRENLVTVIWSAKLARVWKFHVDWVNPANSTLTGPSDVTLSTWTVAPGTVPAKNGNDLDTLLERAMMQNQYTNLNGTESLWLVQTVAATTTSNAAVRWYQVDVTGGTVITSGPLQQSTFDNGDDGLSRFMPSLAVDKNLDMAVGYSVSSSTLFPAIRYAGRLASDPPSTLGQTETSLIEGTASQCCNFSDGSSNTRWGDYSAMVLDPDGCRFWYTNEYYAAPQPTMLLQDNWQTRIGSFHFAGCAPPGNLQGTVTNAGTGNPIAGATVTAGANTTTTDSDGFYLFANLEAGAYTVTATAPGFSGAPAIVTVPSGGTAVQNFALSPNISGCLTDTTQADFQAGAATSLDLASSPGDVKLASSGGGQALDQQNTTVGSTGDGIGTTQWIGQSFNPGVTGQLTQVDADLFCSGCTGTVQPITVEVRTTSGGLPTTSVLATASIAAFSSGAASFRSAIFSTPATLTAGTTYAVIARVTTANSAGTYAWLRSNNQQYANGDEVTTTNSGSTWAAQNRDNGFKTYITTSTTYLASGTLVSSLKDANPVPGDTPHWTTLSWTAATPAGTTVKFQVAASNSVSGPFNFVGPDGTGATFFTSSGVSLSQFNGNRYLKYEAFLGTDNTATTPTLSAVTVCYANGCSGQVNGTACNDGNACTLTDTCQNGTCVGSSPVVCTALDQCHVAGTCDPGTGVCSNPTKPDGTACDDGNACTTGEVCTGGACGGGIPVTVPEVNDSLRVGEGGSSSAITWNDLPGPYNVYQGSRVDGAVWSYDQTCLAAGISVMSASDAAVPTVSTVFFYLVTRVNACGESIPGRDSGGLPIPNNSPCP